MSIIKGKTNIVAGFGGTKRPLGEVYFSQSSLATDNPGALPGWTGEYYENGKTLFPDLYNFVKAHSELQVTKTDYDNAIATYGECKKYVVDENEAQTSLRLPKYSRSHGTVIKEKKPTDTDATWYRQWSDGWLEQGGEFYPTTTSPALTFLKPFTDTNYSFSVVPSLKGSMSIGPIWSEFNFDTKTTTGVQLYTSNITIRISWHAEGQGAAGAQESTLYPWISAYTAAIPASVAQAAEFTGSLSGKANTDLSNTTPTSTFKEMVVAWGLPDFSAGVSLASGTTISQSGWVWVDGYFTAAGGQVVNFSVNGSSLQFGYNASSTWNFDYHTLIPVNKGDVWTCDRTCTFFPLREL